MRTLLTLTLLIGCPGALDDKAALDSEPAPSDTGVAPVDSDAEPCVERAWYADADDDRFGDPSTEVMTCEKPEGAVLNGSDCDDEQAAVYPGAPEICMDGLVNDCDDTDGSAAAAACSAAGPYSLVAADAQLFGEAANDLAGWSLAGAGDANGDGFADFLVGAPYGQTAYRVMGPVAGPVSLGASATRVSVSGGAGWSVANGGDQDGDELPDMLIGVRQGGDENRGQALVVGAASTGDVELPDVDSVMTGEGYNNFAGQSVAGLGDVDGDGWDDVAVGALHATGSSVESYIGHCADEDWEANGVEDGVSAGAVYVVRGPASGDLELSAASARVYGEDGADLLGYALGSLGDLNGDGAPDLLMSAIGQCEGGLEAGAIYVLNGPISGELSASDADLKAVGEVAGDRAGQALSGAGDVNGDGYADLVAGAQARSGPDGYLQGEAYLVLGPGSPVSTLADADGKLLGEAVADRAGYSVASAGDVDLDGYDDLLVGAYGESSEAMSSGAAYLVQGPVTGTVDLSDAAAKWVGSGIDNYVGWSVAGVGDIDADGLPDLLVGGIGDSTLEFAAGAVSLILGGGPMLTGGYGP